MGYLKVNMKLITTAQFSNDSITTYDVDNIFSNNYEVYQLVFSNFEYDTAAQWIALKLLDSTGSPISTNYTYTLHNLYSEASSGEYGNTSATSWVYGVNWMNASQGNGCVAYIFNPYQSTYTHYTYQSTQYVSGAADDFYSNKYIGSIYDANPHRGIQIVGSSNMKNGKVSVYGIS